MFLVIFGAGASYDSSQSDSSMAANQRLPLAKDLFAPQPRFREALRRYPRVLPIVDTLRQAAENEGVEVALDRLYDEREENPSRGRQLNAALFYIRDAILKAQEEWDEVTAGVTNYSTLLDRLQSHNVRTGEPVSVVTFNYDTLIDDAFQQVFGNSLKEEDLSDYVRHTDFKLFKVHGSTNWHQAVDLTPKGDSSSARANQLIERGTTLPIESDAIVRVGSDNDVTLHGESLMMPAIALPLSGKDRFVMPDWHYQELKRVLEQVTRVLVVGWRGADTRLLDLWQAMSGNRTLFRLLVVSASFEEAKETAGRINQRVLFRKHLGFQRRGFSDFMRDPDSLAWVLEKEAE